ncbi:MAG: antibiotic biosynthesis monooxygenase [Deltaproteobacteria bacterium]|nr:antibiotic biosynthesis monooxygenase [Deltaproteobacteria bacterium]
MGVIIIAGTVDVDPEQREAALEAAKVHQAETRKNPGCLDYVWSADPLTPGRIYVFERWTNREALEVHFASPHFPAMRDTIAAHGICGLDVSKYKIALSEGVYDAQGQPRADFSTD